MTDQIAQLNERIKALQDEKTALMRAAFADGTKDFFAKYPEVRAVAWTQYTPYFNDGEPCEFGAYTDADSLYVLFTDTPDTEDIEVEHLSLGSFEEGWDYRYGDEVNPRKKEAVTSFGLIMSCLDSDVLEEMFGDHAKVVVTKDGVIVEYYEHD